MENRLSSLFTLISLQAAAMNSIRNIGQRVAGNAKRQVSVGLVVSTMLFTLFAITAILAAVFFHAIKYVDELDRASERKLVANYLERAGSASIAQQKVQLTWDDAFKAVANGRDMAWADTYLGDFLWSNFHYDRQFLVTPHGRLVRAWADGKVAREEIFEPVRKYVRFDLKTMAGNHGVFGEPAEFRQLRDTKWPFDVKGRPLTRWSTSFISYQGRPAMLTIASILPDTDFNMLTQSPDNLVAVRFLDDAFLSRMSDGLLLNKVAVSNRPHEGGLANSFAISGQGGERLGWLTWTTEPRSKLVQAKVVPLFVSFILFLLAMLVGGVAIVRTLLRTTRELTASEAQAHHNALHDAMTGLPNRAQFFQGLKSRLEQRESGNNDDLVIVLYFDLDHFKYINDTLGHHVGDELICQVARRVREQLHDGDLLARLGGDEFVLMRSARRGSPGARDIGRDMIRLLGEPFTIFGHVVNVTASCGISWAPDHSSDPGELLRNADIALYRAKHRGRGRWRIFTPDMDASVRWRHELEVELRRALAHDELHMVYQPIVATDSRQIEGLEALLRWDHPDRGEIGPGVFVPIAEQSGLMEELGRWVLRRVFAESGAWPSEVISINLSPLQIMSRGFVEELRILVDSCSVNPSRYIFEVTEGILLDRADLVLSVFEKLREMGFRIALDDFGTGFSSLSYLRMFRFDHIKIDRSFVQNIENDIGAHAILRAITSLGRSLRMKIVAEGVETNLQHDLVMAAGCELVQGHHYWHAMAPHQVTELLGDRAMAGPLRNAGLIRTG